MMLNEQTWERTTWKNPNIEFLFGANITEYDMKRAGLNLTKQFKLLPQETITMLEQMEKKAADKKMGLIQRQDKEYAKKLLEAFKRAREWFIRKNNLTEDKIVCIKKDAIFTIDAYPFNIEKGYIRFVPKNSYTSYFVLNKIEFFINTRTNVIDIKGLGQGEELKRIRELHGDYILDFIISFCKLREQAVNPRMMVKWLTNFISAYRRRELPIEYYRELDKGNSYSLYDDMTGKYIMVADTNDKSNLDINKNYIQYILPLANLYI